MFKVARLGDCRLIVPVHEAEGLFESSKGGTCAFNSLMLWMKGRRATQTEGGMI